MYNCVLCTVFVKKHPCAGSVLLVKPFTCDNDDDDDDINNKNNKNDPLSMFMYAIDTLP